MRCQPDTGNQVYIWSKNKQFCLLCDEPSGAPHALCHACELDLPWLGEHCSCCALPLVASAQTCGACQRHAPAFSRVVAPWRYDFPIDSLVTRFKHQAKWPLGRLLAERCAEHLRSTFDQGMPRPDALLPVPLAPRRLRRRGFNQAAWLADWLGAELRLPVRDDLLRRPLDTAAQQGLDASQRRRNLRGAFTLSDPAAVDGAHLALVDDVLTTGATADALARLLRRAGAERVDVYCLARTPAPGD